MKRAAEQQPADEPASKRAKTNHDWDEFEQKCQAAKMEPSEIKELWAACSEPETKVSSPPALSTEQKRVVDMIRAGKSMFFTGCAGTGKSFLLQEVIKALPARGVFVTASTGMAAVPIKGSTLHSFAGIGLGNDSTSALISRVQRTGSAVKRWTECRTLIIDEISMIGHELFDKLEAIARAVRRSEAPFGGIQLVICGDFLQLPPVSRDNNVGATFAFLAESWSRCVPVAVELQQVFRQSDREFVATLGELRRGQCSPQTMALLKPCIGRKFPDDGIEPTRLYCTRADVTAENTTRLLQLDETTKQIFTATDSGKNPQLESLQKNCPAADIIELRVGAQVMLLKNLDTARGLVNGSRGVVTEFATNDESKQAWPRVRFTNGLTITVMPETWEIQEKQVVVAMRSQVPLMLAWSITVHKCQGMSLDRVNADLGKVFEVGQAYTALSRARSLEGLGLVSLVPSMVRAAPAALKFYDSLKKSS